MAELMKCRGFPFVRPADLTVAATHLALDWSQNCVVMQAGDCAFSPHV